jgi:hypothetical protein
MSLSIGSIVASAGRRELEGLDGEGEILVIGVEGEEPVVDALLQTLGLVAFSNQGAGLSSCGAFLNSGSLGQGLIVGLDSVDNNSPLSVSVDSTEGLDVSSY